MFNKGFFGLDEGERDGLTISADFKLKTLPVPLPMALPLFVAGLAGLGVLTRRTRKRL